MNREGRTPVREHLRLRYGKGEIPVDLTGLLKVKVLSPERGGAVGDLEASLRQCLGNPVDSPPLSEIARGVRSAVISIPDRTRPAVAKDFLPGVVDELLAGGIALERMSLFVATGTHGVHSQDELRGLVGSGLAGRMTIHQNEARRRADFTSLGTTTRGTQVLINRCVAEADLNVIIGTVATHYFAGWGGGRKMIVPGSSYIETAWSNHRLTLTPAGDLNPMCRSGVLEGNPVHEDMIEAVGMLNNLFLVNILLDGWGKTAGVNAGHIVTSHLEAIGQARRRLEVAIDGMCDLAIVSAGGHPLDIDFIQSHKSIDHVVDCVRDGGVMVVLGECANGAGSETFLPWFDIGDARAVSRRLLGGYELNGHTALSLMKKLERVRIVFVSSLARDTVERMGMIPAEDIGDALSVAASLIGENVLAYVFPCAWGILPVT